MAHKKGLGSKVKFTKGLKHRVNVHPVVEA